METKEAVALTPEQWGETAVRSYHALNQGRISLGTVERLIAECVREAVLAEREACARLVDEAEVVEYYNAEDRLTDDAGATLTNVAAAIRARPAP